MALSAAAFSYTPNDLNSNKKEKKPQFREKNLMYVSKRTVAGCTAVTRASLVNS